MATMNRETRRTKAKIERTSKRRGGGVNVDTRVRILAGGGNTVVPAWKVGK